MTMQKSFKRLVRSRMEKTGESYTAARVSLLAAEVRKATEGPALTVSEAVIQRKTGRGWEQWFDLLDEWGAADRSQEEASRWVSAEHGVDRWGSQAVTINYHRARGLRAVGEGADGFTITASKTWRYRSIGSTRRSSTRRCASAGCPRASCVSAPCSSRAPRALIGAWGTPASTSSSLRRARRRAPRPSSTSGSPTPPRRSG